MKTITFKQVMDKNPCAGHTPESIGAWFPGKNPRLRVVVDAAIDAGVPLKDIVFHGIKFLSAKDQRLLACDWAERACKRSGWADERSLNCIDVARRYAHGKATREERIEARAKARSVADAAGVVAACVADAVAAVAAAVVAVYASADHQSERMQQINEIIECLERK